MTNPELTTVYGPDKPINQARQAAEMLIGLTDIKPLLGIERSGYIDAEPEDITLLELAEDSKPSINVSKFPNGAFVIAYEEDGIQNSSIISIYSEATRVPSITKFNSGVRVDMTSKQQVDLARDLSKAVLDISGVIAYDLAA
jgi:hypothetical protein